MVFLQRIVSGGQTGADRAALDWAIQNGIAHGGWCPQGRWAEDGPLPSIYQLRETPDNHPTQRTEWNVRDSDGTVIFSVDSALKGGSKYTQQCAVMHDKPCLHLRRDQSDRAADRLVEFIRDHRIKVLNVAGPRASSEPEVGPFVKAVLEEAWKRMHTMPV